MAEKRAIGRRFFVRLLVRAEIDLFRYVPTVMDFPTQPSDTRAMSFVVDVSRWGREIQ